MYGRFVDSAEVTRNVCENNSLRNLGFVFSFQKFCEIPRPEARAPKPNQAIFLYRR